MSIDLDAQQVKTPSGETFGFEIDAFRKHCLLNGLDDIALTLQQADKIHAYETRRAEECPWIFGRISPEQI